MMVFLRIREFFLSNENIIIIKSGYRDYGAHP